ncbi:Short-chain dehydrogenase/reductase phqE [Pseudocercospora fuligena]|uniref:Short-chain dehydrogenase/reductase phqE n=1 Tax=Pseudocercospora fuligena TaxID=685502 RepID=A0A8H6RDX8_9PEZI|nr:Short-chain dehydrogenase/reductase phqE [Pseudocercospora fuligena]
MTSRTDTPHTEALASSRTLVIGGTSGIGFAVASGAIAFNSHVFITSSSEEKVSKAISRLQSLYPNGKISGIAADLSSADTVESNIKLVLDEAVKFTGGPLDHIVSTAGARWDPVKLDEVTAATAIDPSAQTLRLIMPLMVAKHIAKYPGHYLSVSTKSSFTMTSGILVKWPQPGMSSLILVGAGVEGLSRCLAIDLKPIRVNLVTPGVINTELLDARWKEVREKFAKSTLVNELGAPNDCAEAYLFAMRSKFLTGHEIIIDGGTLSMLPVAA